MLALAGMVCVIQLHLVICQRSQLVFTGLGLNW
jgi:hypothetical protein